MNKLTAMECFVRAVETGSFSAVGRELGIGQPNVSRYIAALEQALGTQLLHRSTRKLLVTPEGQRYYESPVRRASAPKKSFPPCRVSWPAIRTSSWTCA
jgi:hypothetical protein